MDMKLPQSNEPASLTEEYGAYLDEMDLTETQKASLLEALWSIMAAFVNMGFGADSVQLVLPAIIYGGLSEEERALLVRQTFDKAAMKVQEEI